MVGHGEDHIRGKGLLKEEAYHHAKWGEHCHTSTPPKSGNDNYEDEGEGG